MVIMLRQDDSVLVKKCINFVVEKREHGRK